MHSIYDELPEVSLVLSGALNEANAFGHSTAGADHVFLDLLQEPLMSTYAILKPYTPHVEDIRVFVEDANPKWIFKRKRRLSRLTTGNGLSAIEAKAVEIARKHNPDAKPSSLDLLEAILTLDEPTMLAPLLLQFDINPEKLLVGIELRRDVLVMG